MDKADQNLHITMMILTSMGGDEGYLDYAGFHLQQAVELAIRHRLELAGIAYPKTHDIDQLRRCADDNGVLLCMPACIREHGKRFTLWEAGQQNVSGYHPERKRVVDAADSVKDYIEREQIQDRLLEANIGSDVIRSVCGGDKTAPEILQSFADSCYVPDSLEDLFRQYDVAYAPVPDDRWDDFER